ncbi:MAG: hypothetical protein U0232_05655 [Thermomicrobiales bacterium]
MRDDDPALDPPTRAWIATTCDAFLAEPDRAERPVALSTTTSPSNTSADLRPAPHRRHRLGRRLDRRSRAGLRRLRPRLRPRHPDAPLGAHGPIDDGFRRRAIQYGNLGPFHLPLHFGFHPNDPARIAEAHTAIRQAATIPTH